MRIGFVVSELMALKHFETTMMMAFEAHNRGHEVWLTGVGDFAVAGWRDIQAHAVRAAARHYDSTVAYHADALPPASSREWIDVRTLDALMLRSDSYEFDHPEHWSNVASIRLGKLAAELGVVVLPDPGALFEAIDKVYVERLPESCRPHGLVTRNPDAIRAFVRQYGAAVVKPVEGACGRNTFLLTDSEGPNVNQIIRAATSNGYAVAQEYVREAALGTIRLFFLDGQPLQVDGRYAALMHVPSNGDMRSNIVAGGTVRAAELDDATLRVAAQVGPHFAADGLFLVGADIAGGKVLDVGANTPGGMWGAERFAGARFAEAVVVAIEQRVLNGGRATIRAGGTNEELSVR